MTTAEETLSPEMIARQKRDAQKAQLRPLVSCKPFVTLQATPPPPDDVAIVVDPGVGDGCFVSAAERAFHPDDEP